VERGGLGGGDVGVGGWSECTCVRVCERQLGGDVRLDFTCLAAQTRVVRVGVYCEYVCLGHQLLNNKHWRWFSSRRYCVHTKT